MPLRWATVQTNLVNTLLQLAARGSAFRAGVEEAVAAYRAALEERTRERVPRDWADTQSGLGGALMALGKLEIGTARLEEAMVAYRAALEEFTPERVPLDWAGTLGNYGTAAMLIADRTNDAALAEAAVRQIENAYEATRLGGHEQWARQQRTQLTKAQAIRDRLKEK